MTATVDRPPDHAGELRGVARSGGISLVGSLAAAVFGFALVVLVSRGLGAAGAGTFSAVVAVVMTLTVAGRFGADTALVRTLPRLRQLGRDGEVTSAVAGALVPVCVGTTGLAALLWWLAPMLAPVLLPGVPAGDAAQGLRVVAALVPLGAAGYVALAATRGLGTVVPLTMVESIVKPALRCLLVAVALLAGSAVFGVTVAWAVPTVIGCAAGFWALHRTLRRLPAAHPAGDRAGTWRELWTFGAPRGVASVFEIAGMHVGVVLAGALAGAEAAGIYNAVLRLALAGTLAMQALRMAMAPQISRLLAAGDHAAVERVHRTSTTWVVLLSLPLYVVMAGYPGPVMAMFGTGFASGAPALALLAAALCVNLATGNVATVLLMSGRSGVTLAITAGSLTLGIAATVALAPMYGVLGCAIAKAASVVAENVAVTLVVRHRVGIRTLSRPLALAVALAVGWFALPAGVLHVTSQTTGATMSAAVLLGGAGYLFTVWRRRSAFDLGALSALRPGRRRTPSPPIERTRAR